jgi:hypothetical protein
MQRMSSDDAQGSLRRGYEGVHPTDHEEGQKLEVDDDEQYADLLARKIKQELREDWSGKDPTIGYRLALAIVSICILVPLFVTLVIALGLGLGAGGGGIVLGYGMVAMCLAIIMVNIYFNRSHRKDH